MNEWVKQRICVDLDAPIDVPLIEDLVFVSHPSQRLPPTTALSLAAEEEARRAAIVAGWSERIAQKRRGEITAPLEVREVSVDSLPRPW